MFDPVLAEIRFGTGLSPSQKGPADTGEMLDRLTGPDRAAERWPLPKFEADAVPQLREYYQMRRVTKKGGNSPEVEAANKAYKQLKRQVREAGARQVAMQVLRGALTEDGLRERLTWFWNDHFTVVGRGLTGRSYITGFAEEAIRPHLTGRFADMLWAAASHPLMLQYLDQHRSIGPNSNVAKKSGRPYGINENLAREMLELHTLGVNGTYSQADVTALARLLTGMTVVELRFKVDPKYAEPGIQTILGQAYGGPPRDREADLRVFIEDLASHPQTLRHIAWKLAVHFVSDTPDPGLVEHISAALIGSGGELLEGYRAMLNHPAAWAAELENVKPPFDFVVSATRALDVHPAMLERMNVKSLDTIFYAPLRLMGQGWMTPLGPDGWPEADSRWVTPQGLAGRIQWAMTAPQALTTRLPDPRVLVETALGVQAPQSLRFAAEAAETDWEGVGIILSSPAFQRR